MTNVIKGSDNCSDTGLSARLIHSITQLPITMGHSFQCHRGALIKICRSQDVFILSKRETKGMPEKSKACHQSHVISLLIRKEHKLYFNLQLTKHFS